MYLFSNIRYRVSGLEIENLNYPGETTTEFIIEGVLLDSFDNELELLKGLFVKVEDSLTISEIPFQIIITKK